MNAPESNRPMAPSLQELIQLAAHDLQPEIARRQVELEFDFPGHPIRDLPRVDSIRQAVSLLLADAILRSQAGDGVLITVVEDAQRWEIEIADARETDGSETGTRKRWISHWPPLQQAMREFAGTVELARCPQGGWAVTLCGQAAHSQRAAG